MLNRDEMQKKFAKAGLVLKYANKPFSKGQDAEKAFGLDIRREFKGSARSEHFLMWPGEESNVVQVMDTDASYGQLVLAVKEEEHQIEAPANWTVVREVKKKGLAAVLKKHPDIKGRIFVVDGEVVERRKTPANRRCFLIGLDERQLFMASLPRQVTTVKQAHESLKATRLTTAEGKHRGLTQRQGEWFFVHPSDWELSNIETMLKKNTLFIEKGKRVFESMAETGGKPHVADELVKVPEKLVHGYAMRPRMEVYVRGAIRHPDHKTIKFSTWRKVLRNNEGRASAAVGGGTWID